MWQYAISISIVLKLVLVLVLRFYLPDFSRTEGVTKMRTVINELQGIYSLSAFSIDLLKRR